MLEALLTFIAVLVTWWCFRILTFLRRLSEIQKPIPAVPSFPVDYLVEEAESQELRPWDWLLRFLGLPVRWLGFAYPFAYQDVKNASLTGSEILLIAHSRFGPVLQLQAFGHHVVQIQDAVAAKTALANLDKDSSTMSTGINAVAFLWNRLNDSLPRSLLALASGEAHRERRSLFKASFHQSHIKTQEAIIASLMTKFASTFDAAAESGEVVFLAKKFSVLAVEVICESAMCCDLSKLCCDPSRSADSFHETYSVLAKDLEIMLKSFFLTMIPPLAWITFTFPAWLIPSPFLREVKRARARVDGVVEKIYEHIMGIPESSVEENSFVAAIREYSTWPQVTKFHVKMELTLFFIAGHETTANTLSWFFFCMCKYPDVQRQCQGALDEASTAQTCPQSPALSSHQHESKTDPGDGIPAFCLHLHDEILPPLVESCIKESMRLNPVVPGSTRKVNKSLTIHVPASCGENGEADSDEDAIDGIEAAQVSSSDGNGRQTWDGGESSIRQPKMKTVVIPSGTFVNVNFLSLHRDEKTWGPDAANFEPTRFLRHERLASQAIYEGGGTTPDSLMFAPFSHGHRGCIGKHLSLMEIRLCVKQLLSQYSWQFADPAYAESEHIRQEVLTVRPRGGVPVIVSKRAAAHAVPRKVPGF